MGTVLQGAGHRVTVRDCPDGVRRLLHLAHLRSLMTVEDSAAETA